MKSALLLIDLQQDFLASADLQPAAPISGRARGGTSPRLPRSAKFPSSMFGRPSIAKKISASRIGARRIAGCASPERPATKLPTRSRRSPAKPSFTKPALIPSPAASWKKSCAPPVAIPSFSRGLHLHACVRTAAVESLERDLRVVIAEDAVASNDPIHAAATRRWLAARCVSFESSERICFNLSNGSVLRKMASSFPAQTGRNSVRSSQRDAGRNLRRHRRRAKRLASLAPHTTCPSGSKY